MSNLSHTPASEANLDRPVSKPKAKMYSREWIVYHEWKATLQLQWKATLQLQLVSERLLARAPACNTAGLRKQNTVAHNTAAAGVETVTDSSPTSYQLLILSSNPHWHELLLLPVAPLTNFATGVQGG